MESTGVYWKPVFNILEAGFVPPLEVREMCDLCRMRTTLVRECVQVGNRLRKGLEDANVKLDSVASNTLGVSVTRKQGQSPALNPIIETGKPVTV